MWAEQACAYDALSRPADAKAAEAKLVAKPEENWMAMVRAAACRKDTSAVADLVVAHLENENTRDDALELFVPFHGREVILPFEREVRETVQAALRMPAVQEAFRKTGRTVPYAGTRAGWSDY